MSAFAGKIFRGAPTSRGTIIGGGRMIGEGCHFVDLASALTGANVTSVYASATAKSDKSALLNDNLAITLKFANGSVASIVYTADGSAALAKEYVEVHGGGRSALIRDFREAEFYHGEQAVKRDKSASQNKGQQAMLNAWTAGLRSGEPCVSYQCLMTTSLATVMAIESLTIDRPVTVNLQVLEGECSLPAVEEFSESGPTEN